MPGKLSYEEMEKRVQELEQVETELKKTEEELDQIFSMSLDMICIADINTATFIKVNSAFTEILGYNEKELLDKSFLDFIHLDDIDATRTVIEKELQMDAKVINFENRYRCKDGSYRWLRWVSHPNTVKGVTYAVAHDITEHKQAVEELNKSLVREKLWVDIVREANVGVAVGYPDGSLGISNHAFQKITGYTEKELQRINWNTVLTPHEWVEYESAKLQKLHETKKTVVYEKEYIRKDGVRIPIELMVSPDIDKDGNIHCYRAFITDITERKQARKILEKKEEQYRLLFEKMMNGFAVHEMVTNEKSEPIDYVFLEVNSAFEKFTGLKKENILGKKVTQVLPGTKKDPADWIGRYGKVAETGADIRFEQYSDALGKWFSVLAFSPKKGQFATIFEDITFRKETESSLKAIEWLIKKSPNVISGFSQDYSDLTELNTCRMILDNIGKDMLSDIVSGYLELLETSAAVYEKNGDYAHGIFSSGWCRMMDSASRKLCNTPDDRGALNCGKWLCHESCWTDASMIAIDTTQPVDIECNGGLRIYAVPITVHDQAIGTINFGYGDPPKDAATLEIISKKYQVDINDLIRESDCYEHRPNFIIETAKKRLRSSAKLIGAMVESKVAQTKLQQEQERLDVTLQSIGDAVITTDIQGKVVLINKVAQTLTGWCREEACGRDLIDVFKIINELTQKPCENPVKKVLETKEVVELANHTMLIARDGSRRVIADSAAPIIDAAENTIGVVLVFRDMTEKFELETALRHAQKMEALGKLAGGIAHEFNNILSIIIGNNELILEDLPEWNLSRESSQEIRLASLRARDIVKHLLTFSRQDDSTKKPINIGAVVTETLKLIRSTTPTNIEIMEKISPNCLPILGDATQINQILLNLCNNAVDVLPISGGRIEIELCNYDIDLQNTVSANTLTQGKCVKLLVRDNGSGMPKEILGRIFDPYFTTKDVGKGSGIGLAVVHGIVENHGGSIVCESAINQGTIFTILIPAHEDPIEEESNKTDILFGNGEKILYVDDEPSIAKFGRRHLETLGYDASSTTNPKEALEMIKNEPERFDLVISDMAMPNMPGDQLIAEILLINPEMPTMICSGYSSRMSETKALEMGIKAFVMKPLNKTELAKKVREILDGGNQTASNS